MKKKNVFRLVAIVLALGVAWMFMFCEFHLGMTPLTKFFVVFFA